MVKEYPYLLGLYTQEQIQTLVELVSYLQQRFNLPPEAWINDPSSLFKGSMIPRGLSDP